MKSDASDRLGVAVSETSVCAIYLLSSSGEILSWNRGARNIKGWERAEITGLHFSVFYDGDERARNVPEENLTAAREHGRYSAEGWRLRRDGSVFRALVDIEFLCPAEGEQATFIKIVRDVSRHYEERVALSNAQRVISRRKRGGAVVAFFFQRFLWQRADAGGGDEWSSLRGWADIPAFMA